MTNALTLRESVNIFMTSTLPQIAHSPKTKVVATIALGIVAGFSYMQKKVFLKKFVDEEIIYLNTNNNSNDLPTAEKNRNRAIRRLRFADLAYLTSLTTAALINKESIVSFIDPSSPQIRYSTKTKAIVTISFGVFSAFIFYLRQASYKKHVACEYKTSTPSKEPIPDELLMKSAAAFTMMRISDATLALFLMTFAIFSGPLTRK